MRLSLCDSRRQNVIDMRMSVFSGTIHNILSIGLEKDRERIPTRCLLADPPRRWIRRPTHRTTTQPEADSRIASSEVDYRLRMLGSSQPP